MIITIDRSSVSMGDDMMSHKHNREFVGSSTLKELLNFLKEYVPTMKNSVWVVRSLNYIDNTIGYIIIDKNCNIEIETPNDNKLTKVFTENLEDISLVCIYYYNGSFSSIDRKTGKRVDTYPKELTLLEQVKRKFES